MEYYHKKVNDKLIKEKEIARQRKLALLSMVKSEGWKQLEIIADAYADISRLVMPAKDIKEMKTLESIAIKQLFIQGQIDGIRGLVTFIKNQAKSAIKEEGAGGK